MNRRSWLALGLAGSLACRRKRGEGSRLRFVANEDGRAVAAVDLTAFAVVRHIRLDGNPSQVLAALATLRLRLTPANAGIHEIGVENLASPAASPRRHRLAPASPQTAPPFGRSAPSPASLPAFASIPLPAPPPSPSPVSPATSTSTRTPPRRRHRRRSLHGSSSPISDNGRIIARIPFHSPLAPSASEGRPPTSSSAHWRPHPGHPRSSPAAPSSASRSPSAPITSALNTTAASCSSPRRRGRCRHRLPLVYPGAETVLAGHTPGAWPARCPELPPPCQ